MSEYVFDSSFLKVNKLTKIIQNNPLLLENTVHLIKNTKSITRHQHIPEEDLTTTWPTLLRTLT
jgi:hypothetical protein